MDTGKCPVCGKGSLTRKVLEEPFEYKGRTKTISDYVVHVCDVCGEEIVDKETLARTGEILSEFKRSVENLSPARENEANERKPRYARTSFDGPYECVFPWPEDCFVQCGGTGMVMARGSLEKVFGSSDPLREISENVVYTTAFFEAFPNDIVQGDSIYIRGEGKTIAEAEGNTWGRYMEYKACDHPAYERRRHANGGGFCMKCGMFKDNAFEPLTKCVVCGKPTWYSVDIDGNSYCEKHADDMPEEKMPEWKRSYREEPSPEGDRLLTSGCKEAS